MTARWTILRDVQGVPLAAKVEGIVLHETDPRRAYAVIDCDTYDTPSELWEIELGGPWFDRG